MDQELRTHLEKMEERIGLTIQGAVQGVEDRTAALIVAEVGSLHAEMHAGFARVNERLDRQGFMLAGGTKALGALLEHVTAVESNYDRVIGEMSELRGRIEKLEKRAS